jgi:uncharacterized PurR-regulated membrane protein YhhQ (DUF165 family)
VIKYGAAAGYLATIVAANWLVVTVGLVPVGFGLRAPAGVIMAGAALLLRDAVQEGLGRWWAVGLIVAGAALSATISPALAVASGVAFLISEGADMAIYTPLRERSRGRAVLASQVVGGVLDSVIFLWLAFRSLEFAPGQILVKAVYIPLAIILAGYIRGVRAAYALR